MEGMRVHNENIWNISRKIHGSPQLLAGHSHWNNIRHKKEKKDAQKLKLFTKLAHEITTAIKGNHLFFLYSLVSGWKRSREQLSSGFSHI